MHPNVNCELILKLNIQNIWETVSPSIDILIKTIEIRDEMLSKFREICYEEYLLSLRENYKDLHEINYSEKTTKYVQLKQLFKLYYTQKERGVQKREKGSLMINIYILLKSE